MPFSVIFHKISRILQGSWFFAINYTVDNMSENSKLLFFLSSSNCMHAKISHLVCCSLPSDALQLSVRYLFCSFIKRHFKWNQWFFSDRYEIPCLLWTIYVSRGRDSSWVRHAQLWQQWVPSMWHWYLW